MKVREIPADAVIVDVREYVEFASGHIEGAQLAPLSKVECMAEVWPRQQMLVLVCEAGGRAERARQLLAAKGFEALERQVRIAAGSLVLITLALAVAVSKTWLIGTGVIGAGLVFAGVSNICMMASVLGRLPWNRA